MLPGPRAVLGILLYQGWLAAAFFLGGPIGDWMTRLLASAFGGVAASPRGIVTSSDPAVVGWIGRDRAAWTLS